LAVENDEGTVTLRDYLDTLRRWTWLILIVAVLVPIVAYLQASSEPAVYEASAQTLINRQNLAFALQGVNDPSSSAPDFLFNQAALARVPSVVRRTVAAAHVRRDASQLLANSSVTTSDRNDLLTFAVRDRQGSVATALATQYARQFVSYTNALQNGQTTSALARLQKRINDLRAARMQGSSLYQSLLKTEEQLRTMEALQTPRAIVVREPRGAGKIRPNPRRSAMVGVAFGLVLGLVLAFLLEALDTRVRGEDKIRSTLRLPLLGRVSPPRSRIRKHQQLVEGPLSPEAEAFRIIATSLELVTSEEPASVIMVTSAVPQEGKTTVAANLAVALARQGRRVLLVDADLQAPTLGRLFGLDSDVGLTDIALGRATFDEVSVPIKVRDAAMNAALAPSVISTPSLSRVAVALNAIANEHEEQYVGSLAVLTAGTVAAESAALLSPVAVTRALESLRGRAEIILIDTPPLLLSGAAVALTALVDGVIVVCKLKVLRAKALAELNRVLDSSPARKLGFVVTNSASPSPYYQSGGRYSHVTGSYPRLTRRGE
jgi:polysaccharide biosynthesis transport protein